ncbi:MAG: DUF4153 domain-containing protein, partial [Gammaproteobacteria bacterium]
RRLWTLASAAALPFALIAWWVGLQLPSPAEQELLGRGDELRVYTWITATSLSLYIAMPFLQIFQCRGRFEFPYPALCERAWSNQHIGLLASGFVAVLWLLLGLWAALFRLLDIDFFSELFAKPVFIATVTGAASGFGLALGRERERVIASMRGITLAMLRSLLPLVAGVALLFLAALASGGLALLWSTRSPASLLLSWSALLLVMINAAWGDGREPPTAAWFRRLTEAGIVAMLLFVCIAGYGLAVRIQHYSLTPPRLYGAVAATILGLHAIGYLWARLDRHGPWLGRLPAVNLGLAPLVVAVAMLLHTPPFDPLRISARAQAERLIDGRVSAAEFDFYYMYHDLGRAGAEWLAKLAALESHPEAAAIRRGIAAARETPTAPALSRRPVVGDFDLYPASHEWPPGLAAAIRELPLMPNFGGGRRQRGLVIATEIDPAAPGPEYVVFSGGNPRTGFALRRAGSGWEWFADYQAPAVEDIGQLREALDAAGIATAAPRYPGLAIGPFRFDPVAPPCRGDCQSEGLLNSDTAGPTE